VIPLAALPRLWFPAGVSTYAGDIDRLFNIILVITGLIFLIVFVTLLVFVVKYRHREGRRAFHIHGDTRAELIWTGVPLVIVFFIAGISMGPWLRIRDYDRFPPPQLEIAVTAKQFEWNVTYPGPDRRLGTPDDFTRRNQLHLPVGRVVHVHLTAEDVIHSFFLPEFRVKQDAVPGMSIPVWFEPTTVGTYALGCAELCGNGHYRMRGTVTVYDADEFDRWTQSGGTAALESATVPGASIAADVHTGHGGH
jgi:cytochrome c oxidase subunit II